jgi:hypothetical protein
LLDAPPEQMLGRIADGFLHLAQQPVSRRLMRIFLSEAVASFFAERGPLVVLWFIERYLARQAELGRLRPHEPAVAARAFMGSLVIDALGRALIPPIGADLPEPVAYRTHVVAFFLDGLRTRARLGHSFGVPVATCATCTPRAASARSGVHKCSRSCPFESVLEETQHAIDDLLRVANCWRGTRLGRRRRGGGAQARHERAHRRRDHAVQFVRVCSVQPAGQHPFGRLQPQQRRRLQRWPAGDESPPDPRGLRGPVGLAG